MGATLELWDVASHCGGLSCFGAQALGPQASAVVAPGLQNTGPIVVVHRPSCSVACGDIPGSGIEMKSPALAAGFSMSFFPEPPGKPNFCCWGVCVCLCVSVCVCVLAALRSIWNLSCPPRIGLGPHALGVQSLNHWTAKEAHCVLGLFP